MHVHTHTQTRMHAHTHTHLGTCAYIISSPGNLFGLCCPELVYALVIVINTFIYSVEQKRRKCFIFFFLTFTGMSECSLCFSHAELLEIIIMCTKMCREMWRQGKQASDTVLLVTMALTLFCNFDRDCTYCSLCTKFSKDIYTSLSPPFCLF